MRRFLFVTVIAALLLPRFVAAAPLWSRYYASGPAQTDAELTMAPGSTRDVTVRFVNRGLYLWRGGGTGWRYVSLYAVSPYGRKSPFADASWKSAIQPAALWEHRVNPGETGSFRFTLRAPETTGTYVEKFKMAIEDTTWVDGGDVAITINVDGAAAKQATNVNLASGFDKGINAKAWVVMDAASGDIIAGKDIDAVRSIASLTKLTTVMTAERLGLDANQVVALTRSDEVGGGRLRVPIGTKLSVSNLVASAIIGSANNAANAVARATGLAKEDFVKQMDQTAASLGLTQTSFADPTGIEVENLSTAREVALTAKAAFTDPWISQFAAEPQYEVATTQGPHIVKNTNKLIADQAIDVVGGKTGFTYEAGYSLATELKQQGEKDLVVVVLGCGTSARSFADAKTLAQRAWSLN